MPTPLASFSIKYINSVQSVVIQALSSFLRFSLHSSIFRLLYPDIRERAWIKAIHDYAQNQEKKLIITKKLKKVVMEHL